MTDVQTDLSRIWSRRVRPGTSTRCSSCTRRRSYRAGCRPLQRDEAHDKRQRCTPPLGPVWFTVLTLGAVETARTLADAGPKTRGAVQTHGRAQRWRGRRALARRGGRRLRDTHLRSPVSQVGPLQPAGHVHASGETHRPPLWQWRLQTTRIKAETDQTSEDKTVPVKLPSENVSPVSHRGPTNPWGQEQVCGPTQVPPF